MSRLETVVSTKNTTTAPLGASQEFVGLAEELTSFQELDLTLFGAPANAPGTIVIEFSPDGTNWDISVALPLTGPSLPPIPLRVVLPRFRVKYINGPTPLTEIRLTTLLHRTSAKFITRFLNQDIRSIEPVEVTRAVVAGQKPDDSYANIKLTADDKIPISADSLPLPSGASTEATLAAIKAKTDNIDVAISTRTKPADQQHVLVDNFPATQPVSGPLTDAQLRATAVPVSAAALPLPSGAATQTTLAAVLTELQAKTEPADQQHVLVDNLPATQPISAAALPLPSGASTEATLALIKAKTDNLDVLLSTRTKPIDNQNVLVTNWPEELGGGISKTLYDTDDPLVFYIGTAPQGTAPSAAAWRIKRTTFDAQGNPLATTWTSATAVWDNRTTETYT